MEFGFIPKTVVASKLGVQLSRVLLQAVKSQRANFSAPAPLSALWLRCQGASGLLSWRRAGAPHDGLNRRCPEDGVVKRRGRVVKEKENWCFIFLSLLGISYSQQLCCDVLLGKFSCHSSSTPLLCVTCSSIFLTEWSYNKKLLVGHHRHAALNSAVNRAGDLAGGTRRG